MNIELEVEKIIKLVFPTYANDNWDNVVLIDGLIGHYITLIENLVVREKDKMLFKLSAYQYIRGKLYFDIDHNLNDTLNKLKMVTVKLLNIINTP